MPGLALWSRVGVCFSGIAVFGLLLSGCARKPGYATAAVHGRVTIAGESVPTGFVTFSPATRGPVTGTAIIQGRYRLDRLPAGKHRVTFQAQAAEPAKLFDAAAQVEREVPRDILPDKYRDGLDIEIPPGESVRNFEL